MAAAASSGTPAATTGKEAEELNPPRKSIATAASLVAAISSFLFGYSICVLDSCGELIPVVFRWCNSDWQSDCLASRVCQGLINAAVYLGAAGGSLVAGRPWISGRGSRFQICVSDVMFILGGLSCASAEGVLSLLIGRLVSGLGLGICAIAAPLYIAEVSPRKLRGANSALHGIFIAVGILCSIVFGIPQSPPPSGPDEPLEGLDAWYWRILLGLPMLPAFLQLILFVFVVPIDPPSLLVLQGKIGEARKLLYRSYGLLPPEGGAAELRNSKIAHLELQITELREASANYHATPRIHIYQAICDPFLRCALLLGFGLAALQQLCGINALMSYSNSLFAEAGIPPMHLTMASTLMAMSQLGASIISSKVVDSWGRRSLLLTGPFLQTVSMAVITLGTAGLPQRAVGIITVMAFSVFCMSFSAGLGAVTWLYLSEIYPMEIRGSALSACGVINWLSCFIVVFSARFLSLRSSCRLFGGISGAGFLGVYLWVVETSGCSMDDGPLTPRSARSSSTLLTPNSQVPIKGGEEEDDKDEVEVVMTMKAS
uniref:Hexose transporter 1 n=1 Tax=Alexandrium monilatum TaxID=311494 RepID=A0A7S4Q6K0_9DINO